MRKQKSSCWKTIVSVHVYRNKPIIYILLIWVFHKHVVRFIIINKFGWSESKFKTRKKFKIIYGFIRKVHKHIDMHVTARPSLYLIKFDQQFIESFIKIIPPIHFWTTSLGLNFQKYKFSLCQSISGRNFWNWVNRLCRCFYLIKQRRNVHDLIAIDLKLRFSMGFYWKEQCFFKWYIVHFNMSNASMV